MNCTYEGYDAMGVLTTSLNAFSLNTSSDDKNKSNSTTTTTTTTKLISNSNFLSSSPTDVVAVTMPGGSNVFSGDCTFSIGTSTTNNNKKTTTSTANKKRKKKTKGAPDRFMKKRKKETGRGGLSFVLPPAMKFGHFGTPLVAASADNDKPSLKKVTFAQTDSCHSIHTRSAITAEEKSAIWWSREELKDFKSLERMNRLTNPGRGRFH